jgi:DNA polymerase-1
MKVKKVTKSISSQPQQDRVFYIDGFNLFQANYRSNSAVDANGEAIGGFLGTLIQIRGLLEKFNPQKAIIIFDGPDAGLRRRSMYPGYKSKRRPKKRTATVKVAEGVYENVENETEQLEKLFKALRTLPVQLISIPFYEADDVIAYLVSLNPQTRNYIISNDQDFLQLVTETTFVYLFTKRKLMDLNAVSDHFKGILPENAIYYRTLKGDTSDELIGVKGIGPQIIDKINVLKEKKLNNFGDFWEEVEELEVGKSKKIALLKESKKEAFLMYKLMKLDADCLNLRAITLLREQLMEQLNKPFLSMQFKIFCIKNKLNFQIKNPENWTMPFVKLRKKVEINA